MRIGIDLGGTKTEGVVLADDGTVVARDRRPTVPGYRATLEALAGLVRDLEAQAGEECTVGVGMPGAVSPLTGRVKNANSTWLNGERLDRDLSAALDREVRCANDANCLALSEATDGAAADARVVFAVILGTGVGAGVSIDRRIVEGRHGTAGEWGHNPLPWATADEHPGPECWCGRRGCVETWLSGPGLSRDHARATGAELEPRAIVAAAERGDAAAEATMRRYEGRLARALAHVVNLLDPDVVVAGGGLSQVGRLYANVGQHLATHVFGGEATTPLVPAAHGDASGVRGAAWLWPATEREACVREGGRAPHTPPAIGPEPGQSGPDSELA